jgi:hypothetical protein
MLMVTVVFTNNYLQVKMAESDFYAARQFMQTIALQIDDVAWTLGRTETIRYSSKYGDISVMPSCLTYTISVKTQTGGQYLFFASYVTGIILFNVPISQYTLYNGYHELLLPYSDTTLTLKGASAPVTRVFVVEKLPMGDGSYIRIAVAPSLRLLNSTISNTFYAKLYLPKVELISSPKLAQSVTLTGSSLSAGTINNVKSINVTVSFPTASAQWGFDNTFFHFPSLQEVINISGTFSDVVLETYAAKVTTLVGANP